jgi:hypothetical protein
LPDEIEAPEIHPNKRSNSVESPQVLSIGCEDVATGPHFDDACR